MPKTYARDEVDQFAESAGVKARAGVGLRQDAPQARVVQLDEVHRVINLLADLRLLGSLLQVLPACLGRDPKDPFGGVLIAGLHQLPQRGPGDLLTFQLAHKHAPSFAKCVVDVLEEDQTQDDVFVLAGVHRAPQLVGSFPEDVLEPERLGPIAGASLSFSRRRC